MIDNKEYFIIGYLLIVFTKIIFFNQDTLYGLPNTVINLLLYDFYLAQLTERGSVDLFERPDISTVRLTDTGQRQTRRIRQIARSVAQLTRLRHKRQLISRRSFYPKQLYGMLQNHREQSGENCKTKRGDYLNIK